MFVEVVFDLPLDCSFTYRLTGYESYPPEVGKRVIVPFGKGDRLKTGIIVSVKEEAPPLSEIKEVFDVPDPEPLFTEETLRVCRFVADYYCSSLGEALFRFLPEGFIVEESVKIKVNREFSGELSPNEEKIFNLLLSSSSGVLSLSTIRRRCSVSNLNDCLKRLVKKGAVELLEEIKKDAVKRTPYLKFVSDSVSFKGDRLRDLLNLLKERGAVPLSELRNEFSSSVIKRSLELGLAETVYVREFQEVRSQELRDTRQVRLTQEQSSVLKTVLTPGVHLLYGVTGSGKMEVYLQAARKVVESGKRVIILVPELLLTPELRARVEAYFGSVGVFHGKLSRREKVSVWLSALNGRYSVFIGTRQAVLLPVKDLGLIVVDEEQDPSYKEQQKPYFNARDVAVYRGEKLKIPVLLVSATPSVESYKKAIEGKYTLNRLNARVTGLPLPRVELLDLKKEPRKGVFTEKLLKTLERVVESGNQALLYIPKRGYYSQGFCSSCGYVAECKYCKVPLTYHRAPNLFVCHICGRRYRPIFKCPKCGKPLDFKGYGTERVEEELRELYPNWRIVRLDLDTVKDPFRGAQLIKEIKEGKYSVIVGTNIAVKGHNFPKLTFVGVLVADLLGGAPDFRSSERTFQAIVHAAGRAGRFQPGSAIVQAYDPEKPSVKCAVSYRFDEFYEGELLSRKLMGYPPYAVGVLLEFQLDTLKKLENLKEVYGKLSERLSSVFRFPKLNPAPVSRIKGKHRYIAFLLTEEKEVTSKLKLLKETTEQLLRSQKIRYKIDVDPTRIL